MVLRQSAQSLQPWYDKTKDAIGQHSLEGRKLIIEVGLHPSVEGDATCALIQSKVDQVSEAFILEEQKGRLSS